jgi:hypothetical protein
MESTVSNFDARLAKLESLNRQQREREAAVTLMDQLDFTPVEANELAPMLVEVHDLVKGMDFEGAVTTLVATYGISREELVAEAESIAGEQEARRG